LDEIYFKIEYPYTVALEAAKACQIDTYVGAIRVVEVETLKESPYNWTVTAAPGFHMCSIGINCRDVTPETSGELVNNHNRKPGFSLYPLDVSAFRYALELIVGDDKDVWITDIYGYINVRLDTCVPPANVYWYNPSIEPYPKDWDKAAEILHAAGFNGTPMGNNWIMPNGVALNNRTGDPVTGEKSIYVMCSMSPMGAEIVRRHVKAWNLFFCNQEVADPPHTAIFKIDYWDPYTLSDVVFYNRDHDAYFLCWGLRRNPDYLYVLFHPDMDGPGLDNSPGLNYRPLNILLKVLHDSRWEEYFEKSWIGPGLTMVPTSICKMTRYAFVLGSEELWIGAEHASPGFPWYYRKLVKGIDYETVADASGDGVAIHFLQDITIPEGYYIHIVYTLTNARTTYAAEDLRLICWDAQVMLYYACPYLPIYSRNYFDLYKPGLTCWVPSLGYGSAAYQLKWTYASIHWENMPLGGSINWHLPGPVNELHPWLSTSVYEATVLNRLYDHMLEVDAYTQQDIPWLALDWKIEDWTGPSGEPGMIITFWIRSDLTWQDGDLLKADDFIWQYEFINSIKPSQLYNVWSTYHGCIKYSDYCFSIKVNATGLWKFYDYTGGLMYPRKVWEQFWGDKAAAETFKPWQMPHPQGKLPSSLYGTSEWIFDYWNTTLNIVRVYKNLDWWGKLAASPCRQIGGIYSFSTFAKNNISINTKTVLGLYALNLDTKENCTHAWTLKIDGNTVANGTQMLSQLAFHKWSAELPSLIPGLHTFELILTNAHGTNTYSIVMFVLTGDVNNDNLADMADISILIDLFLLEVGQPSFDPNADLNNDGIIDMADISIAIDHYLDEI
jgi:ABC-type transport system substrate-binding protein